MTEENNTPQVTPGKKSDRNRVIMIIAATSLLIGGSFGVQAIADSKPYQHAKLYMSHSGNGDGANPFMHRAGWGSKHHGRRGGARFFEMSDEEMGKAINRAVKHVSIEIDATSQQEEKITALLTAVAKDMKPLRSEFRAAGEELHKLLVAPTIDREAMEKIRSERLAEAERISKELTGTLADVAEVLTLEQRKVLDKRIEQFKSMRGRWHRG